MNQGPVLPTSQALSTLRPLPADAVQLTPGGLLGDWQATFEAPSEVSPEVSPEAFFEAAPGQPSQHPGTESALVELYRQTGHRPHLDLAARLLDNRGHSRLDPGEFGSAHHQDHVPLRQATAVTGHVLSQLQLLAGAVDVAVETRDLALLAAAERLWESAQTSRTYLTGGQGSRHRDESFGDPYELPPDRAYAETCAAIASFGLSWRLLLATGDVRYADEMERVLHNGIAAAVSVDGKSFFHTNPLQTRTGRTRTPATPGACCPLTLARLMTSLHGYAATGGPSGLHIHLYGSSAISSGNRTVEVDTRYPWDEQITVTITATDAEPWALALRVPTWCTDLRLTINGAPAPARRLVEKGYLRLHRAWHPGDQITLTLAMPARRITAHPRVDATRGTAALVRGPLVYCLEEADLPTTGKLAGAALEDLELDQSAPLAVAYHTSGISPVTLQAPVRLRPPAAEAPLYRPLPAAANVSPTAAVATAIPYFLWANRTPGPMRVWLPLSPSHRP
ncbi:hypothetical protein FB565_000456 [Actinoplanes lutulentus]|uniref:Beta-L-arabinofuranosidase (Glycosyl hydrolase family 127) n=1 Tax=Actinoplanes lutulentus TaxID=1287878 RepID=A0A327ZK77_9ACTN|nr:beta-L-arabinofuranosidase domain-containing protein [Actinoplanes lutulentus]MBB2940752.1 hypothetical protein [Actinoplanes lutulentus]RAK43063.1 hypothetical protein B0I29_101193 [Actinoplanes lutulentus]